MTYNDIFEGSENHLTNTVHLIRADLVKCTISKKVDKLKQYHQNDLEHCQYLLRRYLNDVQKGNSHLWVRKPTGESDANYLKMGRDEIEHYSLVRVVELPTGGFVLHYGVTDLHLVERGTGPFKTAVDAANWFLDQGR